MVSWLVGWVIGERRGGMGWDGGEADHVSAG